MLERERELSESRMALDDALAGRGRFLVVEGPAGIGKTELLRAVSVEAGRRGTRVLTARGLEIEREVPFGGVRQLLEPALATIADPSRLFAGAAAPAARLFAEPLGQPAPPSDPFATLNALYWVLVTLTDRGPVVVLVDDLHWLDRPTLQWLQFLQPRIEELSALIAVATRPVRDEDGDLLGRIVTDPSIRLIGLRPLSDSAIRDIVAASLGEPDRDFVRACGAATRGNPFLLTELMRDLATRGIAPRVSEIDAVRTIGPRTISHAIRFRGSIPSEAMRLAQAVAVLGDGTPLDYAAEVTGLDVGAAGRLADALIREGILAPGTELAFVHPIVRTAIYDDLAPHERAAAHKRAAAVLQSRGAAMERCAGHLLLAEPAGDEWVVDVLQAAASTALRNGAPEAAVQYLSRALDEPPPTRARAAILLALGIAQVRAGLPAAADTLMEASRWASEPRVRAEAAVAAVVPLAYGGRRSESAAMLDMAAAELSLLDSDAALQLEARIATMAMYQPEAASAHLRRLDRIDERELKGDSLGQKMMLCLVAYRRMWHARDAERAVVLVERAVADGVLARERGSEAPEMNGACITLIAADRLEFAADLITDLMSHAQAHGSRLGHALLFYLQAALANRRGDLRDAESAAHLTLELTLAASNPIGSAVGAAELTLALVERGALDAATDVLRRTGLVEETLPPDAPYLALLGARGRLRFALGDVDGALRDLHDSGRRQELLGTRNPVFVPWRGHAALAHRARGELDRAGRLADEDHQAALDWGTPGAIGSTLRVRGVLESGPRTVRLLHEAVDALAASPARLEQAKALGDLGAALRRAGQRAEARDALVRALDLADRCGATTLAARVRDELAVIGVRPRRSRLTGMEALTASERRVAQMAAEGAGNSEIAQSLFVTRKTVEKHLGNAYMKLGVRTRRELRSALAEGTAA